MNVLLVKWHKYAELCFSCIITNWWKWQGKHHWIMKPWFANLKDLQLKKAQSKSVHSNWCQARFHCHIYIIQFNTRQKCQSCLMRSYPLHSSSPRRASELSQFLRLWWWRRLLFWWTRPRPHRKPPTMMLTRSVVLLNDSPSPLQLQLHGNLVQ